MVRLHDTNQTFDAVIDVHEGSRLLTVSPDFNVASAACQRHLPRNGGRCLLFPSVVRA